MTITIKVKNYRAVERAELELARICCVAGLNGSGKSTLVSAVQAALTGTAIVLDDYTVKEAMRLVRRGADMGFCTVHQTDTGETTVSWPRCKVMDEGETPPRASRIAVGLSSPLDMKQADRAEALVRILNPIPTGEEVAAELGDIGYKPEAAADVLAKLAAKGWDVMHRSAQEHVSKLRGAYEAQTGEKWGIKKSADWKPAGWTEDLGTVAYEDLQMAEVDAGTAIERAIANGAITDHQAEQLRATANAGTYAEAELATNEAAVKAATAKLVELQETRDALPAVDVDPGIPCPKCGAHLIYDAPYRNGKADRTAATLKLADVSGLSKEELRKRRDDRAAADGAVSHQETVVKAANRALEAAQKTINDGKEANAKLATLDSQEGSKLLAAAKEAHATAKARRLAYEAHRQAAATHAQIVRTAALAELLAPEGMRAKALRRELAAFNTELAAVAKAAQWPAIAINESIVVTMGDDLWPDFSESDKWRARLMLQLVIAKRDGSVAVVVDRADVCDKKRRPGVFAALAWAKLPALVTLATTLLEAEKLPPLAKMKVGDVWWLDAGVARRLSDMQTDAAA